MTDAKVFPAERCFSGEVRDLSSEGLGVVDHPNGKVVFVPGTWPGDVGVFEVLKEEKRYGQGRLVELKSPSPSRVEAPCPHLGFVEGACGGCPWMMATYESQLQHKQKRIDYLLQRNQLLSPKTQSLPIMASQKTLAYRNRAQFKSDGEKLGFVSPGTKTLVDIPQCLILTEKNQQHLQALREMLPNPDWRPGEGYIWNFLDVDEETDPHHLTINKRRPFQQGNHGQNQQMREWLRRHLQAIPKESGVVELFAGSGNFTSVFVEEAFSAIACAEINREAVEILNRKRQPGVEGFVIDLYRPARWKELPTEVREAQILFLDPPREGFRFLQKFVQRLPRLRTLFYVSCEPHQWGLDIKPLTKLGWQLAEVQPLDLFPQTPHIELLSVLTKP